MLASVQRRHRGYKIVLFLHILSVIVAFAPASCGPSCRCSSARRASRWAPPSAARRGNTMKIHGPAFFVAGIFGCGLVG